MSTDIIAAVMRAVALVARTRTDGEPLSVLVLGDPGARTCSAIAALGHRVSCCPDLQREQKMDVEHAEVVAETVTALLHSRIEVDLAVAVEGWPRVLEVHPPDVTATLVEWMRRSAGITLMAAPRRILAPDLNELGPYEVHDVLGRFRFLAERVDDDPDGGLARPLILASDQHLLVGDEWIPSAEVEGLGERDAEGEIKQVRTFRVPGDRIVKIECTSEDYFERAQVVGEWAFLEQADEQVRARLDLPRVRQLVRGRAVTTLVRDDVPGVDGADLPLREKLDGVVDIAARYAETGIFHNDVRPWNVLWHDGRPRMIDFADASGVDDDVRDLPQVLALAGSLAAVATDEIRGGEHFHGDVLRVAHDAGLLERWPLTRQLGDPWFRVPRLRQVPAASNPGRSAASIMRDVLEVTVG